MDEISAKQPLSVEKIDRAKLLCMSSWLLEDLRGRLARARFVEKEGDPIKLQYLRVMVQAVQAHNTILKDEELENIKARIALIEAAMERRK
jgi:hypothetical protein